MNFEICHVCKYFYIFDDLELERSCICNLINNKCENYPPETCDFFKDKPDQCRYTNSKKMIIKCNSMVIIHPINIETLEEI